MGKGHCYYSGSPLQYAFDEVADKSVKVFDLVHGGVQNLKDVPLTSGKKLIRLTAENVDTALSTLDLYPDNLVELTLILSKPLTSAESQALAAKPNLVSLIPQVRVEDTLEFQSRKNLSSEELFNAYYKATYGAEPKEELKTLFLTAMQEISEE
jgi:exonuclease SbcD